MWAWFSKLFVLLHQIFSRFSNVHLYFGIILASFKLCCLPNALSAHAMFLLFFPTAVNWADDVSLLNENPMVTVSNQGLSFPCGHGLRSDGHYWAIATRNSPYDFGIKVQGNLCCYLREILLLKSDKNSIYDTKIQGSALPLGHAQMWKPYTHCCTRTPHPLWHKHCSHTPTCESVFLKYQCIWNTEM